MGKSVLVLVLAVGVAGCASGSMAFDHALVLYRSPLDKEAKQPTVYFGFVDENHPDYVVEGSVLESIPGAKPIVRSAAQEFLDFLAEEDYPEGWMDAADLITTLASHARQHLIVSEIDGKLRVLIRPDGAGTEEVVAALKRFVLVKRALIEIAGYRTGFRVIRNTEGARIFEKEKRKLESGGGGR